MKKKLIAAVIALRNLLVGGNIVSLLLLKSPTKMVSYISESLFLFRQMAKKTKIPHKSVWEILPSKNIINEISLGNFDKDTWFRATASYSVDIINLLLICKLIQPKVVFEIGTFNGYTAFHFAMNTPSDTKIYTLDLPRDKSINLKYETTLVDDRIMSKTIKMENLCFEKTNYEEQITCLFGDSATFDFSPYNKKVDFFFIDGSHSYEYVRLDTFKALKCCHSGSVIAWHDFGRMGVNGVTKFITEISKKGFTIYSVPGGSVAFTVLNDEDLKRSI